MTVLESWGLNTVTLMTNIPELTSVLENVIIFDVRFICKFSEIIVLV